MWDAAGQWQSPDGAQIRERSFVVELVHLVTPDVEARVQRVMEAYQTQSPRYGDMLNHYNARCLSGSSMQPAWGGEPRYRHEHDRRGYHYDREHRGW